MRNSEEALLRKVGESNLVKISEAVDPKEYKANEATQTENEWKQKIMHGSMWDKRKVLTGIELGSILQKEIWKDGLRSRYVAPRNKLWEQIIWYFILTTQKNPLCVECAEVKEKRWPMWWVSAVTWHRQYRGSHDNMVRYIYWQLQNHRFSSCLC